MSLHTREASSSQQVEVLYQLEEKGRKQFKHFIDDWTIAENSIRTPINSNNINLFRKSLKSKIASSAKDELKRVKANQSVLQKLYLSFSINLETLHYFSRRNLLEFFYTLQVEKLISLTTEVPNVPNCIIDGQH